MKPILQFLKEANPMPKRSIEKATDRLFFKTSEFT